jgi:hypothetical protein
MFYANNGRLSGTDPVRLQQGLTIVTDLFKRMGLHLNTNKTKPMVYFGGAGSKHMSAEAYAHRFDKFLPTATEGCRKGELPSMQQTYESSTPSLTST